MDWSGQVYAQYLMWTHKSHDATTCPHGVPPRSGEMRRLPSETLRTSGNLEVHVGFARSPDAFASDEFFSPLLALSVWADCRSAYGRVRISVAQSHHQGGNSRGLG